MGRFPGVPQDLLDGVRAAVREVLDPPNWRRLDRLEPPPIAGDSPEVVQLRTACVAFDAILACPVDRTPVTVTAMRDSSGEWTVTTRTVD